jgi:hypothetical protein
VRIDRALDGAVAAGCSAAAGLAVHTAFNLRMLRTPPPQAASGAPRPRVSVLIPARDEAARIAPCLRSVLASTDVELELVVCDDGSTDGTAATVQNAAALGKPHACQQLADAAAHPTLVFVDADVRLAPTALARTVALLDEADLDLVSPYPRQEADGLLPRLVQPLLQWSWLALLPLGLAERSARPSLPAANGQLLACRAASYRRAGGHAAVRADVVEDVALARAFKRAGLRATVADGTDLAVCRMYDSAAELRDGYGKSLWAAFGSPGGAAVAMGFLLWCYGLPPLAAVRALLRGRPARAAVPAAGYAAGVASRVLAARRTGGRAADAVAHPLSVAGLAWLTARSWLLHRRGAATWKGRPVG